MSAELATWDGVNTLCQALRASAQAGDWLAVDQAQQQLRCSVAALLAGERGAPAPALAASCLEAIREATELASQARDVLGRRVRELRAGGRAVAAYAGQSATLHRRV